MPDYTHLKEISNVGSALPTQILVDNIMAFFNWGLLEAGGFVNIPVATPGTASVTGDEVLYPIHRDGVTDGTIWQASHTDWVWESGLEFGTQPTQPSGVYVNGAFQAAGDTYYVNYPLGQINFATPIATNSLIQAAYAWRWVSIYGQQVPWFTDLVLDAALLDNGVIALFDKYRIQPPLIVVEPVMTRRMVGYELGSGNHWVDQDFLFHVIAEDATSRNGIVDVIMGQQDKTFYLYDVNARRAADDFNLDWRGELIPDSKMYPSLVADGGYRWNSAYFSQMIGQDVSLRLPLYRGIVRATLKIVLTDV